MELIHYKTCKHCKLSKARNNYHDGYYEEFPTKKWRGLFCPDCVIIRDNIKFQSQEAKRLKVIKHHAKPGNIINQTCKCCNINKPRHYLGNRIYLSDDGRRWHGRICPDCYNGYVRSQYAAKPKAPKIQYTKSCKFCAIEFTTEFKKQLFCSDSCKVQKSRANRLLRN